MSDLHLLNPQNHEAQLLKNKQVETKQVETTQDKKNSNPTNQPSPLLLAYMELRKSVEIDYNTAVVHSKQLEANSQAQDSLIIREDRINFYELKHSQFFTKKSTWSIRWNKGKLYIKTWSYKIKKTIKASVLANLEIKNQEVAAVRSNLQNNLTTLRQDSQINETNLNSVVNETTNTIHQGSSIMQMLFSLTQVISRI